MLERATEADQPHDPPSAEAPAGRFARDPAEFAGDRPDPRNRRPPANGEMYGCAPPTPDCAPTCATSTA